ncbi:RICIN domain-containing protein [Kitasatospora camelliae]|uniref:RICIN domain-containing protein n=1 Tax=Kitasatospora camelliae TaxID=3156397 RepID=A0AAU8JSL8_9ACTN
MARRKAATTHKRRNHRRLMITVTSVTAALIASAVGVGYVTDARQPDHAAAVAEVSELGTAMDGVAPSPASGPQHKEAPAPIKEIPKNDPPRGLIYNGLTPAGSDDRCVGVYKVSDAGLCTHGPDAPPKEVDISKDTPPVAAAAEKPPALQGTDAAEPAAAELLAGAPPVLDVQTGTTLAAAAPAAGSPSGSSTPAAAGVVCDGDGSTGNRVQVLYVHAPGKDRFAEYLPSFRKWAADSDTIYNASAQETGGVRHIRYVTQPDCSVSVLNVEVPANAIGEFGAMNNALSAQGYKRKDRKYMVFADAQVYCGIGTFAGDERPSQDNLSNFGPSYGRTDTACWGGSTAAHELGHNLGAVNNSAPNTSRGGHCVDEWDIMCYSDSPYYPKMRTVCPDRASDDRLDCNHDDYYNTDPKPGSYLATHWNVANNQFLIKNNGDGPNPNPNPSPTPTPTASPTKTTGPTPNPSPTGSTPSPTAGPTTGPDVTVSQITTNSAVLSWRKVDSAAGYEIQLDGRPLATVTSTVVRFVQLRPETEYKIAIAVKDAAGKVSKPGRTASFRTLAATGPVGPTKPGTAYTMVNSLTGQAADMWGGSTADGGVLIAYQKTGYTNQQWMFEDAGNGYLKIKSVKSGKCLQIGGTAVRGQYVAQQTCSGADTQQWKVAANGSGYALTAKGSSLVLGTSKRWYYGGWLLELQQPNDQAYQNWTIQQAS